MLLCHLLFYIYSLLFYSILFIFPLLFSSFYLNTLTQVTSYCVTDDKANASLMMSQEGTPPASRLTGVLTRDLANGTVRRYLGMQRAAELRGESRDLHLPNATCADAGYYVCHLSAPVGEQNREGRVLLTPTGEDLGVKSFLLSYGTLGGGVTV